MFFAIPRATTKKKYEATELIKIKILYRVSKKVILKNVQITQKRAGKGNSTMKKKRDLLSVM